MTINLPKFIFIPVHDISHQVSYANTSAILGKKHVFLNIQTCMHTKEPNGELSKTVPLAAKEEVLKNRRGIAKCP